MRYSALGLVAALLLLAAACSNSDSDKKSKSSSTTSTSSTNNTNSGSATSGNTTGTPTGNTGGSTTTGSPTGGSTGSSTIPGGGVSASGALQSDIYEVNDDESSATPLVLPVSVTDLSIHSADDEDFFVVQVSQAGRFTVDLSFVHSQGDVDVDLLEAGGSLVEFSRSSDDDERIDTRVTAGTYYLDIWGWTDQTNAYDLSVTFGSGPIQADAHEDNNTSGTATTLSQLPWQASGLTLHEFPDHDWYRFDLATQQTITIDLTNLSYTNNTIDLTLHELGSQGHVTAVASAGHSAGTALQIQSLTLPAGTYFIQINVAPGSTSGGFIPFSYDLSVTP